MSYLGMIVLVLLVCAFQPRASKAISDGAFLLVANKGEQTLGIVDVATGRQLAAVPEGGITGHEVAASPDGRLAYVPIYGNSGVGLPGTDGSKLVVIDVIAHRITGTVDFGHGVRPHCAVIGPKDGLLYVTTEIENAVTVIDPHTLRIVGSIPTGQPQSHMLAITPDGKRGYTANVGPGTVSVLDMTARKLNGIIPVCSNTQRISLSVDGRLAFTSDQTSPRLAVIDTETNKLRNWIPLPGSGYGSAPTPDGRWLVIALPGVNKVAFVDLTLMKVASTVEVPRSPQEVLVRPDGKSAFVSCDASARIAVIDLERRRTDGTFNVGRGADGLAWAASK